MKIDRRDFLAPWRRLRSPPEFLRPPGAARYFTLLCERCGACTDACPERAISDEADGTPRIFPRARACTLCEGQACTRVCPSGALQPIPIEAIRMGLAKIDPAACWAHRGQPCDYCEAACPLDAIREAQVDPERCVGCGLCEYYCTSTPPAITVKSYA